MQKLSFNTITLYQNDLYNECIYAHFRRAMPFSQVHTARPLIGPYLIKYSKIHFTKGIRCFIIAYTQRYDILCKCIE